MIGDMGLAYAMQATMSHHFNEAAKACEVQGIKLKVTGVMEDWICANTRALVEVTYPNQAVQTIVPCLNDLPSLVNILPENDVENRHVLAVDAKNTIQNYDAEQARQRQENWDNSTLGKAVAWVGRHLHL